MLHATELLGGEAYDRDGHFVGQVTELFIEPADQPNRVARVLLGRGKFLPLIARYDHVAFVAPGVIRLERRRERSRALSAERSLAGHAQGFARPADHRYQRPQSRARE